MIQFQENLGIMNNDSLKKLQKINIVIVGLGGLGGHIANTLARIGVNKMTLVDFDTFSLSNLNRQLFSTQQTIGAYKVDVVKKELLKINPNQSISTSKKRVQDFALKETHQVTMIIDAVDDVSTKLYLEKLAYKLNTPLVHGAISGWFGQFGISVSNSFLLHDIYQNEDFDITKIYKSPSFTPAIIANMMVSEIVKYIVAPEKALINKIMQVDLLNNECHVFFDKR